MKKPNGAKRAARPKKPKPAQSKCSCAHELPEEDSNPRILSLAPFPIADHLTRHIALHDPRCPGAQADRQEHPNATH